MTKHLLRMWKTFPLKISRLNWWSWIPRWPMTCGLSKTAGMFHFWVSPHACGDEDYYSNQNEIVKLALFFSHYFWFLACIAQKVLVSFFFFISFSSLHCQQRAEKQNKTDVQHFLLFSVTGCCQLVIWFISFCCWKQNTSISIIGVWLFKRIYSRAYRDTSDRSHNN